MLVRIAISIALFIPGYVSAHCPLCTAGAGAVAGAAVLFGVQNSVVGLFLGAFAMALGLWFGKKLKFNLKYKEELVGVLSWVLTILPLMPLFKSYTALYVYLAGDYGSLLNRSYIVDKFIIGSIVGALIVYISPYISRRISEIRKKTIDFQGIIITFVLLAVVGIIFQLVL